MDYKFPHITNLKEVETAIKGRGEFVIAERDFGYVVNYNVALIDTFAATGSSGLIRRECRGLKFNKDGHILARPYHKFFNLNERNETQDHVVDFGRKFVILDKLDGSMVHPILFNNEVVYCTKMGPTDIAVPVQHFADRGLSYNTEGDKVRTWYNDFSHDLLQAGLTPIFEWCSRKQRIVIEYPQDMLVLTAVRNTVTGEYKKYDELRALADPYKVPVVNKWDGTFEDINAFANHVKELEGLEGYVIRFHDGHMLKIKNLWYLQLHKTAELMQNEKDVWRLVLTDSVDDARAFMEPEDQKNLDRFQHDVLKALDETADRLYWASTAWQDNHGVSRKRYAEYVTENFKGVERGIMFKIFDGQDAKKLVYNTVESHLSTATKLDSVRFLANNLYWDDYNE